MAYLSNTEKAKISLDVLAKLKQAKDAYEQAIADLDSVIGGF